MKQEIERKFLVHPERLPEDTRSGGVQITQGYLSFAPAVRVRLTEGTPEGPKAWLTIKGPGTVSRQEFEYEIPAEDARALLNICHASLTKIRHRVTVGNHVWDVDEFTGPHQGLWLAEVELSRPDEPFVRPDWIGEEVSHDPRYTNAALALAGRAP